MRPLAFAVLVVLLAVPARAQYAIQHSITGSAGGFPTYVQALAMLDQMRAEYPALVGPRTSIGQTHEGRDLWVVELGDNPGVDEGEPEALFTALLHGSEPLGLTTALHTMWYLLERYGTDPEATYLLDNRRLFVVPIANPDGYAFNTTTWPGGGGTWLTNRAPYPPFSGANLDHNFGVAFGAGGASCGTPAYNCWRGPFAFSELETQAIRAFVNGRQFRTALGYHSFHHSAYRNEPGRAVHAPWGHQDAGQPPDADALDRMAEAMAEENDYRDGALGTARGAVDGTALDWLFGATAEHARVYAFDLVVGYEEDWPGVARLQALARENVRPGLWALWYAGAHVAPLGFTVSDTGTSANGHLDPGETGQVSVRIRNDGRAAADVRFRLRSASPLLSVGEAWSAPVTLAPGDSATVGPFPLAAAAARPLGISDDLALAVEYAPSVVGERLLPDLAVGTPEVLYAWDGTSLGGWCQGNDCPPQPPRWGLTADAHSPPTAFTDTPGQPMIRGSLNAMQTPVSLSGPGPFYLSFWAKWQIWSYNSLAAVFGGTSSGSFPLPTRRTRPADPNRPVQSYFAGYAIYDGSQNRWIREVADLTPHAATPFELLFAAYGAHSSYVFQGNGFSVDDIGVFRLVDASNPTAAEEETEPLAFGLAAVRPNPVVGRARLVFTLGAPAEARLVVYDALGRAVATLAEGPREAGRHEVVWDASGQAAGVYVVRLAAAGRTAAQRFAVVR